MIELEGEQYLDGDEASAMLGVKLATLYAYVSRGILHSYKQGIKRQRLYKTIRARGLATTAPRRCAITRHLNETAKDDDSRSNKGQNDIPLAEDWVPYT